MGSKKVVIARRYGGAITNRRLFVFLTLGFAMGMTLGYVLMGTAHAVLESKGNTHFGGAQTTQITAKKSKGGITIHTLATSNGSPYQNYQMRIAYATYKLMVNMPGGEQHVGFTRILHRTTPDELMDEIPTFRADPLQPKCDDWCEYPVSDRGNAVRQFFEAAKLDPSMISADWIYMIESDYVFMKPLTPPPEGEGPGRAWGFPFDYIQPKRFPNEMRVMYPESKGPVTDIPNTGPAPMLMLRSEWEKITPEWERLAAVIEGDENLKTKLGWVREMYGFSVALALANIKVDLPVAPRNRFISQLPVDSTQGDAHAFHYTQCTIYKTVDGDKDVWKYDKRFYTSPEVALKVPRIEEPPSFQPGKWKFIEGNPVKEDVHKAIETMIKQMNRGIDTLKDLSK